MSYRLRPVRDEECWSVLAWRNRPEVRRVMLTKEVIEEATHQAWWARKQADPGFRMMIAEADGAPLSVQIYFDVVRGRTAWWAFYFTPHMPQDLRAMMTHWRIIEAAGIAYGFAHLEVETLLCEVLRDNDGVLRWHRRFGFEDLPRSVSNSGAEHDLAVLGMERPAWQAGQASGDLGRWHEVDMVPHRFDRDEGRG